MMLLLPQTPRLDSQRCMVKDAKMTKRRKMQIDEEQARFGMLFIYC
jgi:hypothetical protein